MDLKFFTGPITKSDAGGLDAVISTPRVDRDGESVDPKGLTNRDEWLANPLIYWAHEWAFNPMAEPIGKGSRLDVFADRIESSATWAPTPKAQNIRALVSGGFVRKTSIGFDPIQMTEVKGVPTHTQWALREWSVVPMPANTDATITAVKSALHWLADDIGAQTVGEDGPNTVIVRLDASELLEAIAAIDNLRLAPLDGATAVMDGPRRIATLRARRVAVLP